MNAPGPGGSEDMLLSKLQAGTQTSSMLLEKDAQYLDSAKLYNILVLYTNLVLLN
jgi:hypothetical protein